MAPIECTTHGSSCICYKKGLDDGREAMFFEISGRLKADSGHDIGCDCGSSCVVISNVAQVVLAGERPNN